MEFEFATANRILFGPAKVQELGALARSFGRRALIVAGRSRNRVRPVCELLAAAKVAAFPFHVAGEPAVDDVRRGVELAKAEQCDLVIGFGGGSALDAAKAVAALLTNPGDLFDYLEVVGRGQALSQPGAPCLAVPTTAGTGAEVTRNSVLAAPEHGFKVSLRSLLLLPRVALVDPELSCGLGPELTATTGLDALTQLIEPFLSHRANPLTDAFCLDGLERVSRSLLRAVEQGGDIQARADMALASLFSGLALANAGLGAVHGFAAPLGGMYSAAHGALCAALLPHAMQVNLSALQERAPDGDAWKRFVRLGQVLTGKQSATAQDAVTWVADLCRKLGIRGLAALGVRREDFHELTGKAAKASSMKANPIVLTGEELHRVLEAAYGG